MNNCYYVNPGRLVTVIGSEILIKSAILHDWYKKNEIERAKKEGHKEYEESEHDSYNKLIELGYSKRIAEVAHSVGAFSLKEIIDSTDFLKKLMHYIDDICLGDMIVEVDERIDHNESQIKYNELNESGRKVHGGKTFFEVQREVGNKIQTEIESQLHLEPKSLIAIIKQESHKIK